jgi:hypothetical protein
MRKATATLVLLGPFLLAPQLPAGAQERHPSSQESWTPLFNGRDLSGWFARGKAKWEVVDGVLTGTEAAGHIYADPVLADLEVRGLFRVSEKGNSGLYFRANPPADQPDRFPQGYEAQIDNHSKSFTGWLWKPGKPTAPAKELITRDNEWFSMRVRAVGDHIQIWVNDRLMTEHRDSEFTRGHFAIQCHNPGMKIEAKELFYRAIGGPAGSAPPFEGDPRLTILRDVAYGSHPGIQ